MAPFITLDTYPLGVRPQRDDHHRQEGGERDVRPSPDLLRRSGVVRFAERFMAPEVLEWQLDG